ncbi:F-box-like protein [Ceratobasidium sp. AG-Ba]|nr:F-box-like protein [Ceratobasidium sp. AG-Ba]
MSNSNAVDVISWQTVPADILVSILKQLVSQPQYSYIPLVCTHVCQHWRQAVAGIPSLWTLIDVGRGATLTELWLSRSANSFLDIKLWQPPEEVHTVHEPPLNNRSAVEMAKRVAKRWRSLNISFWCLSCVKETIVFLGSLEETLELDCLTIGPMGNFSVQVPISDPTIVAELKLLSQNLRLKPSRFQMDSFPVPMISDFFSSRLTLIEIFSEVIVEIADEGGFFAIWNRILNATPSLVSLTLWHTKTGDASLQRFAKSSTCGTISLPHLKYVYLASRYLELSLLIACSPLPSLITLSLDANMMSARLAAYIDRVASVAPQLKNLAISHPARVQKLVGTWDNAFEKLQSLQRLTLFEMTEHMVIRILELTTLPKTLTEVRLERVTMSHYILIWPPSALSDKPPRLTLLGYSDSIHVRFQDGVIRQICRNSIDKTSYGDHPAVNVLHCRETELFTIENTNALSLAPTLTSNFQEESSDEFEDSDEESYDDSDTEASFASGDHYVIDQGRQQQDESSDENYTESLGSE